MSINATFSVFGIEQRDIKKEEERELDAIANLVSWSLLATRGTSACAHIAKVDQSSVNWLCEAVELVCVLRMQYWSIVVYFVMVLRPL